MTKNKLRRLLYTTGTIGVLGVLVSTSALDRVVRAAARGDRAIEVGALEKARTHFAEEARPTAATAVVLMTDGENSTSFFRPEQHANAMKAAGTTIWAVGVGTEVSQTELEAIASPDQVI